MKAEEIKKYVNELNISSDEDIASLKNGILSRLTESGEDISEAIETLEELLLETNERLDQVDDEEREALLNRKQRLLEETGEELRKISTETEKKPSKPKTVLVADESEERLEDPKKTRPVALEAGEQKKTTGDKIAGKAQNSSNEEENEKKLEKETEELIKEKQKQQKEIEEKQKQAANEQQKTNDNTSDGTGNATPNQSGNGNGTTQGASSGSATGTAPSGNMDPRLVSALMDYYNRNQSQARESLKNLANAKDLGKEDLGTARFWYGVMLDKGEGGAADKDAALFWMESAAKLGNTDALMAVGASYAAKPPANDAENVDITLKALKCFEKADKFKAGGNDIAKNKYIEICKNKPIYRRAKNRACAYCDSLAAKSNDEYEKKKYADEKEKIKENYYKNNAAKLSSKGVLINPGRDILVLTGSSLVIVSVISVFVTLQGKGDRLPGLFTIDASSGWLSSITRPISNFLGEMIGNFTELFTYHETHVVMPGTLLFGLLFFTIGRLLMTTERAKNRGRITGIVSEVSEAATALTVFGNVAISVSPGGSLLHLGGAIAVGLMLIAVEVVTLLITRRFGK